MTEMSVSMIMRLVDQVSRPAQAVETELEKLKRASTALQDIQSGPMRSEQFAGAQKTISRLRDELIAQQRVERQTTQVVREGATTQIAAIRELGAAREHSASAMIAADRAELAAKKLEAESAAAAASTIVEANERIVASELRVVAATERSAREQSSAAASLQRQRSAAYVKEERDREPSAERHRREQERIGREQQHHGASTLMLGAAASAVSAHSIYEIGKKTIEAGAERQHVEIKAENAGISASEIRRIRQSSIEAKRGAPNMSVTEIQELFTEARSAVKHPEETYEIIGSLAKAGSVLKGMGVDNSGLALIVKAAELLGRMNSAEQFKKYLDGQVKAMQVFGKTITPEQIYEAAKYSKAAGGTLSDDFINSTMPSLIQELRGSSAGDALSMLSRTLRGGLEHRGTAT